MDTAASRTSPTAPARRRFRQRPPRRHLRFTREGKGYIALTLFIGIAAINTGNNLLFLVLGLLLGGIVVSGVLSESVLLGLRAERILPLDLRAGRPALVTLRLVNDKRRLASYAIEVRDITKPGQILYAFFLKVEAAGAHDGGYRWTPERRGIVPFERVEISTRFPFGLFEKSFTQLLPAEVLVFPREVPAPPGAARRSSPPGELPDARPGAGGDFFALRDARPDDDARHIHWATTARLGRPVVVERERERTRRIGVVVDNRMAVPPGAASQPGGAAALLDGAAEQAAALVHRALLEASEFAFSASGVTVPAGVGAAHERRVLRALAVLAPVSAGPPPVPAPRAEIRLVASTAPTAPERAGPAGAPS